MAQSKCRNWPRRGSRSSSRDYRGYIGIYRGYRVYIGVTYG